MNYATRPTPPIAAEPSTSAPNASSRSKKRVTWRTPLISTSTESKVLALSLPQPPRPSPASPQPSSSHPEPTKINPQSTAEKKADETPASGKLPQDSPRTVFDNGNPAEPLIVNLRTAAAVMCLQHSLSWLQARFLPLTRKLIANYYPPLTKAMAPLPENRQWSHL